MKKTSKQDPKRIILLAIFLVIALNIGTSLAFEEFSCNWFPQNECNRLEGCGGEQVVVNVNKCTIDCYGGGHVVLVSCFKIWI